jgi:hypothetical protein
MKIQRSISAVLANADDHTREMYEMHMDGATLGEVARRFELPQERVRRLLHDCGLPTRSFAETRAAKRDQLAREMSDEICSFYAREKSVTSVVRQLGLPREVVSAVVEESFSPEQRQPPRRGAPKRYSDAELIGCLQSARYAGRGFLTSRNYDEYAPGRHFADGRPWPTHQGINNRFGSWREALQAAGLDCAPAATVSV